MKKTVPTFGLISGAITALMMLANVRFAEKIGFDKAEIIGYTTLVLSALLVFFGTRSYRENISGGQLTFRRGFAVGIMITLLSSLCYVATWEIVYYKFAPDFADKYAAYEIERAKKAPGATPQKIEEITRKMDQFKQIYPNPVINVAYTFMEIFPFGLAATLLSTAVLRKKAARQSA